MTDKLVLSASSIKTYLNCPKRWYYEYIEQREFEPSEAMRIGLAVHEAIEKGAIEKTMDEAVWAARASGAAIMHDLSGNAASDVVKLVMAYYRSIYPTIDAASVEHEIQFEIGSVIYTGTIDLIETDGTIRDVKTSARMPSKNEHGLQLTGYAIGYRLEHNTRESRVALDYLVRGKTAKAKSFISGGPIEDGEVFAFTGIVMDVSRRIRSGDYTASGVRNGSCKWCPFIGICPDGAAAYGGGSGE